MVKGGPAILGEGVRRLDHKDLDRKDRYIYRYLI
jgi:hypothetical protein